MLTILSPFHRTVWRFVYRLASTYYLRTITSATMARQTQTTPAYASPQGPGIFHRQNSLHGSQKKPWQTRRRSSFKSNNSRSPDPEEERLSRQTSQRTTKSTKRTPKWWKVRLFRGMVEDVKRRAPYYWSDWTDAWDYRVIPATVCMYFAKYDNAILLLILSLVSTSIAYHSSCKGATSINIVHTL